MQESIDIAALASRPGKRMHFAGTVLEELLEGCQVISRDYRYVYVNEAVLRHGRTTREALLGQTMMECYPGIAETEMFATLRRCMEERCSASMENRFVFPDGSEGWFELRFEPVAVGLAILSVEITERKLAELALKRTMRALTTLSRCNRSLIRAIDEQAFIEEICRLVVDSAGYLAARIDLVDPRAENRPRRAASAGGVDELGPAEADVERCVRDAVRTGEAILCRDRKRDLADHRAAAAAPAALMALPIAVGGMRIGALSIVAAEGDAFDGDEVAVLEEMAMDLGFGIETLRARRRQTQTSRQLDEARERAREICNRLPHAIFVFRREGDSFTIVDVNDAARALTSGAGALVGSSARAWEEGIPRLTEDLMRCADQQWTIRRELDCLLPARTTSVNLALTYGFLPPDMVLLHAQDVTEQRQTEDQLVAAQRLEAVGRLAGGVAHDFNNLLSVILTYSRFAIEQLETSGDSRAAAVRQDIAEIEESAQKAAALTRQLLAFSRKQILDPQVTSLNQIVADLEGMLRRLIGEDVAIESRLAEDLGNVEADRGQLEQVIMNLAVNARDAMPRGGRLLIETADVELDEAYAEQHVSVTPGSYVRLAVSDNGCGMSAETQRQIFEPFFTTKEKGKGTGLGLSMVFGIIKQSGGNVWVYSEPGRGTTFKIYLPRVRSPRLERVPPEPSIATTGNETVLLVEDDAAVRRATARILEDAGYRVLSAASGGEALLLCEQQQRPVDLVLVDVVMPEMSGRELAERLKRRSPYLGVLFMSGYTDNAIAHHGVLSAGTHFISKPFSSTELRRKVRDVLDAGSDVGSSG